MTDTNIYNSTSKVPDKIKQIADSYDTMSRAYGKDKAGELIKNHFGIDEKTLNEYLTLVTKKEGRIIPIDEQKKDLETRVKSLKNGELKTNYATNGQYDRKVVPISSARNYGTKTTPISTHRRVDGVVNSGYRSLTAKLKHAVAAGLTVAYLLNPIGGLMHGTYGQYMGGARSAYAQSAETQAQMERLKKIQDRIAQAQAPAQPAPPTAAPPVPSPAPTPAITTPATSASQKYTFNFNQHTDEHEKYRKGEIKYANLSDRVNAWYSLKNPEAELKEESGKYFVQAKPKTEYKRRDLGEFNFGVKVGGEWYFGLKPNELSNVPVSKNVYDKLKSTKRPIIEEEILYKLDGNKLMIYSSYDFANKPKKVRKVVGVKKSKIEPIQKPKE